jgi:hypothetical protein
VIAPTFRHFLDILRIPPPTHQFFLTFARHSPVERLRTPTGRHRIAPFAEQFLFSVLPSKNPLGWRFFARKQVSEQFSEHCYISPRAVRAGRAIFRSLPPPHPPIIAFIYTYVYVFSGHRHARGRGPSKKNCSDCSGCSA